jgi:hypothetical protein
MLPLLRVQMHTRMQTPPHRHVPPAPPAWPGNPAGKLNCTNGYNATYTTQNITVLAGAGLREPPARLRLASKRAAGAAAPVHAAPLKALLSAPLLTPLPSAAYRRSRPHPCSDRPLQDEW